MRRPPLLLLLLPLLLFLGGRAAPPPDSLSQLPGPKNPKIRLYNTKQVLSWEPVSLANDTRVVTYRVEFRYTTSNDWSTVWWVNCTNTTETECDFTPASHPQGFQWHRGIYLRVRAELGDLVSNWMTVPWFQHCQNVIIGPPRNVEVIPGEGSLTVRASPPFDIDVFMATFQYNVSYWEESGNPKQTKDHIKSNFILLDGLKPLSVYCLQVRVEMVCQKDIFRPGLFSNTTCSKTAANAATKLQQTTVIFMAVFVSLMLLSGACFFLVLRYKGHVKYWFHSPLKIPVQIEEYLREPTNPVLEALEKDSSPKEDVWDSVSIVSFPGKE